MKKLIPFVFFIAMIACSQKQETSKDTAPVKDTAYYALSLDSAKQYTANYRDVVRKLLKDTVPIEAFTIRSEDLLEAMGVRNGNAKVTFDHVRVYLGIDNRNKFRLFLTPVLGADIDKRIAGRDTILSGMYKANAFKDIEATEVSDGNYVFDFNMPCPNTCSTSGPLEEQ